MIDRYLVRYFLAVIDNGSFTRAAQHCRVTQPTLSAGIAKLERFLGQLVFDRTSRRVQLTAAGTEFAVHARRIEADFNAAERAAKAATSVRLIRIGVASTFPTPWLTLALEAASAAKDEQMEIVEGRAGELLAQLDRGRLDAVLGPITDSGRPAEILFEEGYGVALPERHSFAARTDITAEQLAHEVMIVRRNCEALPLISRHFTDRGIRPFMAARTTNEDRAAAYVRSGLGVTVMPYSLGSLGIAMLPLVGFEQRRQVGFMLDAAAVTRVQSSVSYQAICRTIAAQAEQTSG